MSIFCHFRPDVAKANSYHYIKVGYQEAIKEIFYYIFVYHDNHVPLDYKVLNKARYEIKYQYLCSAKARRILGWRPEYTLEKGLEKAIEWYRKNRG